VGDSHWSELAARWSVLGPPLRPPPSATTTVLRAIHGHAARVLVLGVTPELADAGSHVVAVERNAAMIQVVWPGDRDHRRAVLGDWRNLRDDPTTFAPGTFTAVVGDGALSSVGRDEMADLLRDLAALLVDDGIVAIRCYVRPDGREAPASVKDDVVAGRVSSMDACKLRLAMGLVDDGGEVPVELVLDSFDELFPDRDALARVTGWTPSAIAGIDAYRGSPEVYLFPTQAELLAAVPDEYADATLHTTAGYQLAERCPVLVLRRP
jgi:SAM-dependent methyltransferase